MYEQFYALEEKPFELSPRGDLLYLSETHKEGLAILRYGVIADKSFVLLVGGVGTGKTTILNGLLQMIDDQIHVCLLNNPRLTRDEFYFFLGQKLNIEHDGNKARFLLKLSVLLDDLAQKGEKLLIIIDEAQAFSVELLEEVRLLSNEASDSNTIGIFLVGQPEVTTLLKHPQLLPLRQRIGVSYTLTALAEEDTAQYISFRLQNAGAANTAIFAKDAVKEVYKVTQGNPRLINIVCDNALIDGFTHEQQKITRKNIKRSVKGILLENEDALSVSEPTDPPKKTVWKRFRNFF